ncbi:hypothetical protein [Desulfovibrio sp. QI0442]
MNFFKQTLHKEASSVFMNLAEFADLMEINGVPVPALWDDTLQPMGEKSVTDPTGFGITLQSAVLFVLDSGGVPCPLPDEEIIVEGWRYSVIKVDQADGILRLELERHAA